MSLFPKNANENAYVGGKKHWVDVIKNSGPADVMIWRQPEEDFNTNSTLIVMPGEEAIFVHNGTVEEKFAEGSYKLSTENYPFISRLRTAFSGGISSFNCVVYFVNTTDSMEILWGTDSPIPVRDKIWNITTDARVRGSYRVRVDNAELFLRKMSGSKVSCQYIDDLKKYFSNQLQGKIKSAVSSLLNGLEQELIGIDSHLEELSSQIEPYVDDVLSEYGLKCVNFSFAAIDIDRENYKKIDDSQVGLIERQREAQGNYIIQKAAFEAEAAGMEVLGQQGYQFLKGSQILNELAKNPGASGAVASMGAGLGMGIGAANTFNTIAQGMFTPVAEAYQPKTAPNTQPASSGRFTQRSADQPTKHSSLDELETVLNKFKEMLDKGMITKEMYDAKASEIMDRMAGTINE